MINKFPENNQHSDKMKTRDTKHRQFYFTVGKKKTKKNIVGGKNSYPSPHFCPV